MYRFDFGFMGGLFHLLFRLTSVFDMAGGTVPVGWHAGGTVPVGSQAGGTVPVG
ncbi:MAG TPA: hypothetical protein PLB02_06670 [Thermoanaerobaculia bacterium]|nr:hypothetical protein [Thermoanaerobaculia bacterium]HQR67059.1 hypothetical protein [Thermoanaerobaculia bacterium]